MIMGLMKRIREDDVTRNKKRKGFSCFCFSERESEGNESDMNEEKENRKVKKKSFTFILREKTLFFWPVSVRREGKNANFLSPYFPTLCLNSNRRSYSK